MNALRQPQAEQEFKRRRRRIAYAKNLVQELTSLEKIASLIERLKAEPKGAQREIIIEDTLSLKVDSSTLLSLIGDEYTKKEAEIEALIAEVAENKEA